MPRFSANLGFLFTEYPLLDRFKAAAAAGFKAVEAHFPYDIPPANMKAELDRHGLVMLGINTSRGNPSAGEFGLAALPGREAEFQAACDQAIAYQTAIGGTAVHCMAGIVAPQLRHGANEVYVRNIALASRKAARHGVSLLLEPINHRDHPDYFLHSVEHAADVIARVGEANVRIMFDCYHVQILQGDIIRRIEKHLPLIGHVQIAGVPARAEPDDGELNYPSICAALDAMGYSGWVGAEYKPRGRTGDGLGWGKAYGIRCV